MISTTMEIRNPHPKLQHMGIEFLQDKTKLEEAGEGREIPKLSSMRT